MSLDMKRVNRAPALGEQVYETLRGHLRSGVMMANSTYSLPSSRRLMKSPCQCRPWVSASHSAT